MEKEYDIPKNLNECFTVLDEIFLESPDEEKEWFKNALEEEAVGSFHTGLGRWMRNTWGLWSRDTDLYHLMRSMELWHADDMYNIIMTSYYRKMNGKELNLKEQIETHIKYWKDYEQTNGPVDKD